MDFFTEDYLEHHGVRGQKWGVRRYQNPDGSLTDKGKKRVAKLDAQIDKTYEKKMRRVNKKLDKAAKKADKEFDHINQLLDGKRRDFKKAAKAQTRFSNTTHEQAAKDIYQKKLADIRKQEVRAGMNYFENARNRDLLVVGLINTYGGAGMLAYDAYKYSPGIAERRKARKDYKLDKKSTKVASKAAMKRKRINSYAEILRDVNNLE